MTTNTGKFAERELQILVETSIDPENRPLIEPFIPEILALAEKFGNSGQSGGSAPYTAGAIAEAVRKLCLHQPIAPITGQDDEWVDVSDYNNGDKLFQNMRCSALFRDGSGDYYLDAITWKTQNGTTWGGPALLPDGTKISSRQFVKSYPFTPKNFVIDVNELEEHKDDWTFYIKDEKQLESVFDYYRRP